MTDRFITSYFSSMQEAWEEGVEEEVLSEEVTFSEADFTRFFAENFWLFAPYLGGGDNP